MRAGRRRGRVSGGDVSDGPFGVYLREGTYVVLSFLFLRCHCRIVVYDISILEPPFVLILL